MSKQKRWKKRGRRRNSRPLHCGSNKHHCLFQGRHWNTSYAKRLRMAFVREVPVYIHNELHNEWLHDVPVPDGALLKEAWEAYMEDRAVIDTFDVCRACAWLYCHIPDVKFRNAMQVQIDFFATRLGRS